MFSDVGPLELVTLGVLAVLLFGPDRLPEVIQNVTAFIRKFREFSENAKQEIRSELGPEFDDFDFEDLHPKTFVRKHVLDGDDLGLAEIRNAFDAREELTEVAGAVRSAGEAPPERAAAPARVNLAKGAVAESAARAPFDHPDAT
ncbi:sec-independent translocase [Streptomyces sp. NPDC056352]|uniref:sec-independent translocase n=1 Tax=Streptomyces sp. NPDC056352 TaxID=3345791 RepID=UPI0035E15E6D